MLKIPLSEDQLSDAISEAKRWFAARKGVERQIILNTYAGTPEYDMPEDCDAVIDVAFNENQFDVTAAFSPYLYTDQLIPYGPLAAPSSGGLYSSFVQSMQYQEMAKRIIGADRNYIYFPNEKKILLLPAGSNNGAVLVQYKSTISTIEQLPERDHDLVKRFALAWAKRDLGMIFSRYAAMPTAQGQSVLNGPALLTDAEKEFTKLEQEVADSAFPMPWVTG